MWCVLYRRSMAEVAAATRLLCRHGAHVAPASASAYRRGRRRRRRLIDRPDDQVAAVDVGAVTPISQAGVGLDLDPLAVAQRPAVVVDDLRRRDRRDLGFEERDDVGGVAVAERQVKAANKRRRASFPGRAVLGLLSPRLLLVSCSELSRRRLRAQTHQIKCSRAVAWNQACADLALDLRASTFPKISLSMA